MLPLEGRAAVPPCEAKEPLLASHSPPKRVALCKGNGPFPRNVGQVGRPFPQCSVTRSFEGDAHHRVQNKTLAFAIHKPSHHLDDGIHAGQRYQETTGSDPHQYTLCKPGRPVLSPGKMRNKEGKGRVAVIWPASSWISSCEHGRLTAPVAMAAQHQASKRRTQLGSQRSGKLKKPGSFPNIP